MERQKAPKLNFEKKLDMANIKRRRVSIPSDKTTYSPGDKIIVNFPSVSSFLKGGYSTFNAKAIAGSGGTYVRLPFPIGALASSYRLTISSKEVEYITEYNKLHGNMSNLYDSSLTGDMASFGIEGVITQATRASQSLVDQVYSVKWIADSCRKYYPMHLIKGQLRLEIVLAAAEDVLESDQTAPSYEVSNFYHVYDEIIDMPGDLENELNQLVSSGRYEIQLRPFQQYQNQFGTSTSVSLALPAKVSSLNRVLAILNEDANYTGIGNDDKHTKYDANVNNLTSLTLRINNTYWPEDRHRELSADAGKNHWMLFRDYADTFDNISNVKARGYSCVAGTDWKAGSRQCCAFDLRKDPQNDDAWNNGQNLNEAGSQAQLNFALSTGYTSGICDFFIQYDATVLVGRGGMISVLE